MTDLITSQKYLDGELDKDEKKRFEEKIKDDKDLFDDIIILKEVNEVLSDHNLHNFEFIVDRLIKENRNKFLFHEKVKSVIIKKYFIAACVALILGFFTYFILVNKKPLHDKLYAHYYVKYDPDIFKRSDTSFDNKLNYALDEYIKQNYSEALNILDELISLSKNNDLAYLYSGLCYMEMKEYNQAIKRFEIPNKANNLVTIHSQWYTALAYLKLQKTENAIELFQMIIEQGGYYKNNSVEIMNELSKAK